jgi:hypothetical protein
MITTPKIKQQGGSPSGSPSCSGRRVCRIREHNVHGRQGFYLIAEAEDGDLGSQLGPINKGLEWEDGTFMWSAPQGGGLRAKDKLHAAIGWANARSIGWNLELSSDQAEVIAKESGWIHVRKICIGFSTEMTLVGVDPLKRKELEITVEGGVLHRVPRLVDILCPNDQGHLSLP